MIGVISMGLIYCATFPNNKKYIGQTTRKLNERINEHLYQANQENSINIFHKAIKKYGKDNIKWEVLENNIFDLDTLNNKEEFWISKLNTYYKNGEGYNMTLGGQNYLNRCIIDENSELAKQIYKDYKECGSTIMISQKYGYAINTINYLLGRIDCDWKQYAQIGKRKHSKFNKDESLEIYELYKIEGRIDIIAEKYEVSRSTIRNVLKRVDKNYVRFHKYGKFTVEQEKEIIEYYNKCNSIKQTKNKFGCSWETIAKIVKK